MQPAIVSKDITLRAETPADRDFVAALFSAARREGFVQAGCPEAIVDTLLDDQFRLQSQHFSSQFPQLSRAIVLRGGQPVGRLYVDRTAARWFIVEIGLTEPMQRRGIGTALITWLAAEAARAGVPALELQVAHDNVRAVALYRRLGFAGIGGVSATHLSMQRPLR